jgi:hypothetical protein
MPILPLRLRTRTAVDLGIHLVAGKSRDHVTQLAGLSK